MKVLLVFFLWWCYVTNVDCQICSKKVLTCEKTKRTIENAVRHFEKTEVQIKQVCCDGYITNPTSLRLQCDPICIPACENGYCSAPGVCTCNEGYAPSAESSHKCDPICTKSCDYGTCVGPDRCMCFFGFHSVNDICVPICNSLCVNGICVAPDVNTAAETCYPYCSVNCPYGTCVSPENCVCDSGWRKREPDLSGLCEPICDDDCGHGTCVSPNTCDCFENYSKSENGTCVPFCSSGCPHGSCVEPENCTCDEGWSKTEPDGVCEPICENGCKHGTCVGPNVCICLPHYDKSEGDLCVPTCSTGCLHGTCVEPDICKCDIGWSSNGTQCMPICEHNCGNGTCVAPNVCECFSGYENENRSVDTDEPFQDNNTSCIPKCHNCHGKCVAPERCVCDPPFVVEYIAADGTSCDCFENCLEGAKICDGTVCVLVTQTTTDVTDLSSYNVDVTFGDDVATDLSYDEENTERFSNDTVNLASMTVSEHKGLPEWIYIVAAVVLISVLALAVTIVVKRRLCDGGDYNVEDDKGDDVNETQSKEIVQYSDLLKNEAT